MNLRSIVNCAKFLLSFTLLLLIPATVFPQLDKQITQYRSNFSAGSEFVGSKLRTRPRIFVPERENDDVAVPVPLKAETAKLTIAELEREAFRLLNEKRVQNGLKPVEWNEDVARVARVHSANMALNNFFSHQGLDGLMVNDRADSLGIRDWRSIGENIAYNRGYENPVEFAVLRWMQSQSHRENLLSSKWKETGVGVAVAADGKTYYFTQVFVVRK
ncbi:MAG: CAP domain-containing protein [Pyrinomonadaceae bacterium]|nr:CAP domain-containing protein [Pyrinomonadaceae bacterium]